VRTEDRFEIRVRPEGDDDVQDELPDDVEIVV